MPRQISKTAATGKMSKISMSYCDDDCKGIPVNVEIQDLHGETCCPICLTSFESEARVIRLNNCTHVFCPICIDEWMKQKKNCPFCRKDINEMIAFTKPVTQELNWDDLSEHSKCYFGYDPIVLSHLRDFNTKWTIFLKNLTHPLRSDITRGIDHLNLTNYGERVVMKTQKFLIMRSNENKLWLVICCLLPNLSIRLVITENAETQVNADDEYADEVVKYLNSQFKACWTVIPSLIDKSETDKIFVRKFENYTARLLLSGFNSNDIKSHKVPMEKQLKTLKKCNFDESHFKRLRHEFLPAKPTSFFSLTNKCSCSER